MGQGITKVITQDSSVTFLSEKYGETYHSVSGAKEEAIKKFAEPCRIAELAKQQGKIKILDVCFGLGYNSAAAIDAAKKANPECLIEIMGLENDIEILKKIKEINADFQCFELIKKLISSSGLEINENNVKIKILLGDARKTIKNAGKDFDAVFLDPFSPKKCPELWTEEFFRNIYSVMKKDAILSTYSCARIVRDNLTKAGFAVKDGPAVGRRAPGTIAVLKHAEK